MLMYSLVWLLLSNSITSRRDKSIMYLRTAICVFVPSAWIVYDCLCIVVFIQYVITENIFLMTTYYFVPIILLIQYIFLMTRNYLVSIVVFIQLQIYRLYLLFTTYKDSKQGIFVYFLYFLLGGFIFHKFVHVFVICFVITLGTLILSFLIIARIPIFLWGCIDNLLWVLGQYIEDPSNYVIPKDLYKSSSYTGKGKGKAQSTEVDPEKPESEIDSDAEYEYNRYQRAVIAFLEKDKKGESSKGNQYYTEKPYVKSDYKKKDLGVKSYYEKEDSHVDNNYEKENPPIGEASFQSIANTTQYWKQLKDRLKRVARDHNDLKIKIESKASNNIEDANKLIEIKKETDLLRSQIKDSEKKLLEHGINPNDQYRHSTESDCESGSGHGSRSGSNNSSDVSSYNSDIRKRKRVKFSDSDSRLNFFLVLSIGKWEFIVGMFRVLCFLAPVISLLLLELTIFPDININLYYIHITTFHLLTIILLINMGKLLYKCKKVLINLYTSYLNKDYFILYTNFYFSIILMMLCSGNSGEALIF